MYNMNQFQNFTNGFNPFGYNACGWNTPGFNNSCYGWNTPSFNNSYSGWNNPSFDNGYYGWNTPGFNGATTENFGEYTNEQNPQGAYPNTAPYGASSYDWNTNGMNGNTPQNGFGPNGMMPFNGWNKFNPVQGNNTWNGGFSSQADRDAA